MGRRRRARVASALITRKRDRHSIKNISDLTRIGLGAVQSIFDRFERHGWLQDHPSSTHRGLLLHSYEITDTGRGALTRLARERGLPTPDLGAAFDAGWNAADWSGDVGDTGGGDMGPVIDTTQ